MKKIGAAIIGCGWVAEEYVKAFQKDQRSELRTLVSRNPANAERYRDRYDLKCTIETDASKMLQQNDFTKIPCILPDSGDVSHHPFQGEVSHFLDCIINDEQPFPDIEDAALTHALCFAADLSAESGRPVSISEFDNLL